MILTLAKLVIGATPFYLMLCLIDLTLSLVLEKRMLFFPMTKFTCFCGWNKSMMSPYAIPSSLYSLYRVKRHMKSCLLWILNAEFNGLTPYWGNDYAAEIAEPARYSGFLTPDYFLSSAKKRSRQAKAGRDPFDDSFETEGPDHSKGDQR